MKAKELIIVSGMVLLGAIPWLWFFYTNFWSVQ